MLDLADKDIRCSPGLPSIHYRESNAKQRRLSLRESNAKEGCFRGAKGDYHAVYSATFAERKATIVICLTLCSRTEYSFGASK